VPDERPDFQQERAAFQQRELGRADPTAHLLEADRYAPGHPIRDSHERVALVSALMLLTHRVGELARVVARQSSRNGGPE
jgi:hypothetical protein